MDTISFFAAAGAFIFWGLGVFLSKLATNRIGTKCIPWDLLGYFVAVGFYSLIIFRTKEVLEVSKMGAWLAIAAGAAAGLGTVSFYVLLNRSEASSAIPLTSLYPALGVFLAFIFLRETVTLPKVLGITCSLIAIYLLSK